ncbi:MAG: tetratricopeptide repeat protein [Candidatus Hydrogenedentes bacterium]|nr:tetratricopeptide repeat protein [Candidatus Hydrogenedentota bacterium]
MDLSKFKWPVIILVVVVVLWLMSNGGVDYMFRSFTENTPGEDAARDAADESGLSKLGGFLMYTFRYEKAMKVFEVAIERYPNGPNRIYNYYRLAKCYEKMDRYAESSNILRDLMYMGAHDKDDRVPQYDVLKLRRDKLIEVHELGEIR